MSIKSSYLVLSFSNDILNKTKWMSNHYALLIIFEWYLKSETKWMSIHYALTLSFSDDAFNKN